MLSQPGESNIYMRHLLQVKFYKESTGTTLLKPSSNNKIRSGDRRGWNKVASLVFAYRLADVIALLNDVELPEPPKVPRTKKIGCETFPDV